MNRDPMTASQKLLLTLLVASIFLNYIDRSNLSLAAPIVQKEFGLSATALGSLFSAFYWTYALAQLFGLAGWLADRYPPALVLAGGLFLWSAATILTGVFSTLGALFVARLLVGAGESVAYPCYSRIFASSMPSHHRGVANALIDAGSKVGPAFGTLIGGMLLASLGWRMFFVVLGIASLLWLVPWFWAMPRLGGAVQEEACWKPATLQILEKRSAWGSFFGHFCGNYFWYFLLTWLPTYLVQQRGLSMQSMVKVSTVAYLTIASATILAGWLSDRWISSGLSPTRVRKAVVVTGLCASTIILPVAVVHDQTISLALLLLACAGFGIYVSNHWAITQTLAGPLAAGRWTSLQNGIGNLAGIAASWLTGFVVDHTGSYTLAFAAAAAVALTGALMWGAVVGPIEPVEWKSGAVAA